MREPLDDLDHRLLELVQNDAGRTLHELGEEVGLSPSAVQRRLSRHRGSGLIQRQVAVLDPEAVTSTMFALILVALERESVEHHRRFHERVQDMPEVQQCYSLAGKWDYALLVVASGIAHCRAVAGELFLSDDNVRRYETMPVFDVVKRGLEVPTRWPERQ
ncbi:Lrp/AsnC family transcriptional regulator [Allokutzneria oryzae]|uniref:Lrp/AsnC family transcriptional regulator n=1 Tax=Allokutzneria oryzae TaxID=1378989 RepID=A0ABV6A192_9PSEU